MIASATAKHIRISARKVRLVLALIRGKTTSQALTVLMNTHRRAVAVVEKLLRSAIANAKNKGVEEGLYISRIFANEGLTWKRNRATSFGRGAKILKRTCHITVELDQAPVKAKVSPVAKTKTPAKTAGVVKKEKVTKAKKKD